MIHMMKQVTETVVNALEKGKIPWRVYCLPHNVATGKVYGGVNPILLGLASAKLGLCSPYWGTYDQWYTTNGVKIEREVVGTSTLLAGDRCMTREFVYNADQTTKKFPLLTYPNPGSFFDTLVSKAGIKLEWQTDSTCECNRGKDLIRIPCPWMFIEVDGFFHALSHEIFHFSERYTGWKSGNVADDELRADIGAALLGAAIGLKPLDMRFRMQHDKYVTSWIAKMHMDPELLFRVCNSVTTAISWLLKFVGMEMNWGTHEPGRRATAAEAPGIGKVLTS
jgi:antirestriction protein ArdC